MGRKLNPIEAVSPGFCDASAEPSPLTPSRSRLLQQQIAEQLGISSDNFSKVPQPTADALEGIIHLGASDLSLSRECLELLDAYIRISDPEQRLRCLQAVQEAASISPSADPASRGE